MLRTRQKRARTPRGLHTWSQLQAGIGFTRHWLPAGKVPSETSRAGICMSGRPSEYLMVWLLPTKSSMCARKPKQVSVGGVRFGQTEYA
jgi:hypothetical protein